MAASLAELPGLGAAAGRWAPSAAGRVGLLGLLEDGHEAPPLRGGQGPGLHDEDAVADTGEAFLNGKIDDPSMTAPLQISAFQQDDGSYNIVWSRPTRRRDVTSQLASKQDEMPAFDMGEDSTGTSGTASDGLGESTAEFAS